MSQARVLKKTPVIAAAVAVGAGLISVPPVVQAAPGCVEWGFPVANTLLASGGVRLSGEPGPTNDDWSLSWSNPESGQTISDAPATLTGFRDKPPLPGTTVGSITNGNSDGGTSLHITFDSVDRSIALSLDGGISPDGNVVGPKEVGGGKISWRMAAPFVCNKLGDAVGAMAPVAEPDVVGEPVLGGIIVHVTDHSGKTSKCHYDSEIVDRDFTLNANSTADLRIVPAVPLGRAWPVTVTCDNGAKKATDIDF